MTSYKPRLEWISAAYYPTMAKRQ